MITEYPQPDVVADRARFQHIIAARYTAADVQLIERAYALAAVQHQAQTRAGGGPYIMHLLRVASYVAEDLPQPAAAVVCTALLHDVVEDTPTTVAEVAAQFGDDVARMVAVLTEPEANSGFDGREAERTALRQQYASRIAAADFPTRLVKSWDVVDNMTSSTYLTPARRAYSKIPRWINETETLMLPFMRSTSAAATTLTESALQRLRLMLGHAA